MEDSLTARLREAIANASDEHRPLLRDALEAVERARYVPGQTLVETPYNVWRDAVEAVEKAATRGEATCSVLGSTIRVTKYSKKVNG